MDVDVVVVGAGPAGLMLACELCLAGARPLVLERRDEPGTIPKANGFGGQIVRTLGHRGLLERLTAEAEFAGPLPRFPFGSVPLDFAAVGGGPFALMIPQPRLEAVLAARARELGADVRRGHEVTGMGLDASGVTLEVRGPDGGHTVRAGHVVGCDGARSRVREWGGIGFPGTTDAEVLRVGRFTAPTDGTGVFDQPELPGAGRLGPGWHRTERGRVIVASFERGVHTVGIREHDARAADNNGPLTLEEFRAALRRVLGADLPLGDPVWLSRTVAQGRLADRYRAGRVMLAGDAAHLFPAGGSALDVGMTDAVNLGWKLAAVARGRAGEHLLDSYHAERHPVGARTLAATRAQAALDRAQGEEGTALRDLLTELFAFEEPLRRLRDILQGSGTCYAMPGAAPHPLLGRLLPDLAPGTPEGPARPVPGMEDLAAALRAARPVLVDLTGGDGPREEAAPWLDRVDLVTVRHPEPPAAALLVRPDGHVAWAGTAEGTTAADAPGAAAGTPGAAGAEGTGSAEGGGGPRRALAYWFGAARPGPVSSGTAGSAGRTA
ncbi:FAD-dependent monooxygenase [Sphaerisporangium sp. B11E5]|uniref:FAD-dependent monooxygenase n=1 Tax=Sphaerisporangium sp. B11E5 TaxID=3153563 RepID=UPI00325D4A95